MFLSIAAFVVALVASARAFIDRRTYRRRVGELQRRILDAERLLRLRGNLANEVAHEIKNPITAILCSAETLDLLLGEQIGDEHRQSLRYIREYGENLLRLVSDFLDISRAEAGQLKAKPERVVVETELASIVGLLESSAIRKKIALKYLSTGEGLEAYIDPKHLKQVLFNLLHNAIKFTPEKGVVQAVVSAAFPRPYIQIAVQDNGPGIPVDLQAVLFDPYVQLVDRRSLPGRGAGLGLSVCKSLVDLAGGSIAVKSEEGVGTEIVVSLPLYREQAARSGIRPAAEEGQAVGEISGRPLEGQSFLVVDEDPGARESVARLIEAWGGVVDRAALTGEAIEALGRKVYDAVMIDSGVDGGYGCELARMIRDEIKHQSTTVIVAASELECQTAESGVDRCVSKPLNGRLLLDSLLNSGKYSITH